jgi:transposase-like protein
MKLKEKNNMRLRTSVILVALTLFAVASTASATMSWQPKQPKPKADAISGVLPAQTLIRASKYLNNLIEQDHRKVKQRCYPMLGFKTFGNAEVTLSGIELANKIEKGQFDASEITSQRAMILQVWEAALAA